MRTTAYSIMHISDLHRSPEDPISNAELVSALLHDRDRYVAEEPAIPAPQVIVVSGDIIEGARVGTKDFAKRIEEQYVVAEELLSELTTRFLDGDRSRLVMVPGNHDVDWNTAFSALVPVERDEAPQDLAAELFAEDSLFRWDWKETADRERTARLTKEGWNRSGGSSKVSMPVWTRRARRMTHLMRGRTTCSGVSLAWRRSIRAMGTTVLHTTEGFSRGAWQVAIWDYETAVTATTCAWPSGTTT